MDVLLWVWSSLGIIVGSVPEPPVDSKTRMLRSLSRTSVCVHVEPVSIETTALDTCGDSMPMVYLSPFFKKLIFSYANIISWKCVFLIIDF